MEHGKFKADRIADRVIRGIDRERNEEVRNPDTQVSGSPGVYRGKLFGMFEGSYTARRVYTPEKKG